MAESPELWAFLFANTILFVFSSLLALLSYLAYRRHSAETSFRTAGIGFALVLLGGLVEPVYQVGIQGIQDGYALNGTELLLLQSVEGVLIAAGLGLLFYAITCHDPSSGDEAAAGTDDRFDFSYP